MTPLLISHQALSELLAALAADGFTVIGPRLQDGARVFEEIRDLSDLPLGKTDVQSPGRYEVTEAADAPGSLFEFCATGQSLKRYFIPPTRSLFTLRRSAEAPAVLPAPNTTRPLAVIGARGCDLAALRVLDGVLGNHAAHPDGQFTQQRVQLFTIAVHCTTCSATSFCGVMGTGPVVREPFDLALTEIPDGKTTQFILETGSAAGEKLVSLLSAPVHASAEHLAAARERVRRAAEQLRGLPSSTSGTAWSPRDLQQGLQLGLEAPHWQDVDERCLACGNCTMACPTCFCTTTADQTTFSTAPVDGGEAPALEFTRVQSWQSCFSLDHSYLHGGPVRSSIAARYRQWLLHKLSTWWDQFGNSGCVGCGRCVTWCPVGIDIIHELGRVLSGTQQASSLAATTPEKDNHDAADLGS